MEYQETDGSSFIEIPRRRCQALGWGNPSTMPLPDSAARPVRGVSWGNTSTMPQPVLGPSGAARGGSLGNPSTMPTAAPEVGYK